MLTAAFALVCPMIALQAYDSYIDLFGTAFLMATLGMLSFFILE
jgi:hypothetical protein